MPLPSTVFARPLGRLAVFAIIAAWCASPVQAGETDCGTNGASIVRSAYPSAKQTATGVFEFDGASIRVPGEADDGPHTMLCRRWPARPGLTLVAVPLMTDRSADGNEGDIELLVVDSANFAIRQRSRLPGLMSDDAFYISNIAFDTARYHLAPGETAFGLRLSRQGSSRPNPFGETALWLFATGDHGLRPVLDNIVVAKNQGEWDTNCAGEFHETKRTLAMKPSAGSAYADIVVTERNRTIISSLSNDGTCASKEETSTSEYRLAYDATAYRLPDDLKRLE